MLAENFSERAAKIEGQINLVMRFPFDSKLFARMLAKIAHSYAMAKLGPHGFRPFLSDLILGKDPIYPAHFVGSAFGVVPETKDRHTVGMRVIPRIDGRPFWVVSLSENRSLTESRIHPFTLHQ